MTGWHEVTPVRRPVDLTIRPPGSKSLTIRSLVIAALARGWSTLRHPLEAEDTAAACAALSSLGVDIERGEEEWTVSGTAGNLAPATGELDVGASGLTARSMIPLAALVPGPTTITGRDRLPQRPMEGAVAALRRLGVEARSDGGRLPVVVEGEGRLPGGVVDVEAGDTTQFLTGMLMVAPMASSALTVRPVGMEGSAGYVEMTVEMMERFGSRVSVEDGAYQVAPTGYQGTAVDIEPDASAAVYPMVAAAITGGRVMVEGLGAASLQPDLGIARHLEEMGCQVTWEPARVSIEAGDGPLQGIDADLSSSPDGALALAVAALFARGRSRLRGLGSLRFKESDRLAALAAEIARLGAHATVEGDHVVIDPAELRPAQVQTYRDHRVAMSFALAGLMVPGVVITEPGVVDKTWPGFWRFLDDLSR